MRQSIKKSISTIVEELRDRAHWIELVTANMEASGDTEKAIFLVLREHLRVSHKDIEGEITKILLRVLEQPLEPEHAG